MVRQAGLPASGVLPFLRAQRMAKHSPGLRTMHDLTAKKDA
jgi:hypothetical protein